MTEPSSEIVATTNIETPVPEQPQETDIEAPSQPEDIGLPYEKAEIIATALGFTAGVGVVIYTSIDVFQISQGRADASVENHLRAIIKSEKADIAKPNHPSNETALISSNSAKLTKMIETTPQPLNAVGGVERTASFGSIIVAPFLFAAVTSYIHRGIQRRRQSRV